MNQPIPKANNHKIILMIFNYFLYTHILIYALTVRNKNRGPWSTSLTLTTVPLIILFLFLNIFPIYFYVEI